ncbi:MAG: family 78 glycoside hydrolase catalytic domain [Clostridia bacterium]|nr:family 78 glycoside hydrolase catalytic domain [Clostridia bacterium]
MNIREAFGNAVWVCAGDYSSPPSKPDEGGVPHFPVLRGKFVYNGGKAKLRVVGLGYFFCYINGKRVGDSRFLPLSTDYEEREDYPIGEKLHFHRLYVPEYDITDLLVEGENLIAIHFGGGWYTNEDHPYGSPKAIYRITVEKGNETEEFGSSGNDLIADSFVESYSLTKFEKQNYLICDESVFGPDFDDGNCRKAKEALPPVTEYLFTDCPSDKVLGSLNAVKIREDESGAVYDCGINTTGFPRILLKCAPGEEVSVVFAEEVNSDGTLDEKHIYGQTFTVVGDGKERIVEPRFIWFGFRYFKISGKAEPVSVEICHSDIAVNSEFDSDSEILNWLYRTYINTQLCNMHGGIPSDCPHIERRGYTGDGQLCAHAAMNMLDCKAFYRKWIEDISDCQDDLTGHVQYTAPYIRSGGGPGGWGSAIIEVPYRFYKHFGDVEPLKKLYPQMLKYIDYLKSHSENDLVVSDKKGEWCLGDWCTPIQVVLPAAFVNNYFLVKSLYELSEIALIIGEEKDIPEFDSLAFERKRAIMNAYYNTWDHNFIGGLQGANAYALDIGLGDRRTYDNMVAYYKKIGYFDTGIFGTEILCRVLFERGDGDLALSLLLSEHTFSYAEMMKRGATTIWEYWPDATRDRSHSHPMFGAPTAMLFDGIAGIKEIAPAGKVIEIAPKAVERLGKMHASRTLASGKVSVDYSKGENGVHFCIVIPDGVEASFIYKNSTIKLSAGKNTFSFEDQTE